MISQDMLLQGRLFVMTIIWGMCLIWSYDVLRVLRLFVTHRKSLQILEEIIFWVTASFLVFILLGRYNNGAVRNYVVCGMIVGMWLYRWLLSPCFMKLSCRIMRILRTFMDYIGKRLKSIKIRVRIDFKSMIRKKTEIRRNNNGGQ